MQSQRLIPAETRKVKSCLNPGLRAVPEPIYRRWNRKKGRVGIGDMRGELIEDRNGDEIEIKHV